MNAKIKHKISKMIINSLVVLFVMSTIILVFSVPVKASSQTDSSDVAITSNDEPFGFNFNLSTNGEGSGVASTLQIVILLTVISIAPSLLLMVTSFTRIIVVLHFVRSALATQTTPPNQVLIGLALFLTVFIMGPVFTQVNNEAIKPLSKGEITQEEAFKKGMEPIRGFMFNQVKNRPQDIKLFMDIANLGDANITVYELDDVPNSVLIPAFMISELRAAFIIGFLLYIPFIVIDMVVASTLMSMGMMMLPPTTISMPFKILLFILADGWNLIIGNVVKTFYG
ncbi:MAG TPA: flagellar biosynthetic protein FliP [Lachnospiraceae bacterium]|uniref:flagellar type III secretion system pore protein FliP n=1 Tax=Anaerosporobacter sp. TaxID=1872529 RepID=UPI000EDDEBB3|nr:flagellar type III secretion system pore protein FliP [Anaerosporobacter sp.]HAB59135.1 flagellar biosynthetic protein FliP [Lachnospiraceae bacterium]